MKMMIIMILNMVIYMKTINMNLVGTTAITMLPTTIITTHQT